MKIHKEIHQEANEELGLVAQEFMKNLTQIELPSPIFLISL